MMKPRDMKLFGFALLAGAVALAIVNLKHRINLPLAAMLMIVGAGFVRKARRDEDAARKS